MYNKKQIPITILSWPRNNSSTYDIKELKQRYYSKDTKYSYYLTFLLGNCYMY